MRLYFVIDIPKIKKYMYLIELIW